jgi:hypothetical protein
MIDDRRLLIFVFGACRRPFGNRPAIINDTEGLREGLMIAD